MKVRLGEDGRALKVGLWDSGEVGVRVRLGVWWDVHRIREHVDEVRVHSHGLEVCRLFRSGSLDREHLGLWGGGVDVLREEHKVRVGGLRRHLYLFLGWQA